jgi:ligand-binding sensor domain-containing protein/serine phosphatase RsbU (regulator of sigma subunit)
MMVIAVAEPHGAWARTKHSKANATKASTGLEFPLHPPIEFSSLVVEDGLPQTTILAIAQDSLGFMWFGTAGGLARYAGAQERVAQMRVYKHSTDDPQSIASSTVLALVADPSGGVWVGTDHGLDRYEADQDRFVHVVKAATSALLLDGAGGLWIGTTEGTIDRYDPATSNTTHVITAEHLGKPVTSLAWDRHGVLWAGSDGGGLIRIERGGGVTRYQNDPRQANSLASDVVNALAIDSEGVLWVGTANGLDRPSGAGFVHLRHATAPTSLSDAEVTAIREDVGKRLWVGTKNGLNLLDRKSSTFLRYVVDPEDTQSTGTFPFDVTQIYQDRGGVMWIGTWSFGLRWFDSLRESFHLHRGGPAKQIGDVFTYDDASGTLWIGSYGSGLYRVDRGRSTMTLYTELARADGDQALAISPRWIDSIHYGHGVLWFGLQGVGLVRVDPTSMLASVYTLVEPGSEQAAKLRIESIYEDEAGKLWLATGGAGLESLDPRTREIRSFASDPDTKSSLPSDDLHFVFASKKLPGSLWIGTAGAGLALFDAKQGVVTQLLRHDAATPTSLAGDDVYSACEDAAGNVWVGTDQGLDRLTIGQATFEHASGEGRAPRSTIYGILADENGRLWLSTNGAGLIVLDPKTSKAVAHYDAQDGLQGNEFEQNGYYKSAQGEMFFAGAMGFNTFHPREIKTDTYAPPAALTSFKLFNQEVGGKPIWTLPDLSTSYEPYVTIEFAALSFAAPSRNRFQYILEGLDENWIDWSHNFVTYNNLPGGKYVFRVRAVGRHGAVGEQAPSIKIAVATPPWKSWWAYVCYALIAAGAAFSYVLYNRRRIAELERTSRLEKVERDIQLTAALQTAFLPKDSEASSGRVHVHGYYRAAEQCSGDWWWHQLRGEGQMHTVLVGDVTGHGPGPAMVTAAAATAFRVQARSDAFDVLAHLQGLNTEILMVGGGRYLMTMAGLMLDDTNGSFNLFCAGSPPALRLDGTGKVKVLSRPGTPLGTEAFNAGKIEGRLQPGDRIMIYTDGIPEQPVPPEVRKQGHFGTNNLIKLFEKTRPMKLDQAVAAIATAAETARGPNKQEDDWTFVIIEWR